MGINPTNKINNSVDVTFSPMEGKTSCAQQGTERWKHERLMDWLASYISTPAAECPSNWLLAARRPYACHNLSSLTAAVTVVGVNPLVVVTE